MLITDQVPEVDDDDFDFEVDMRLLVLVSSIHTQAPPCKMDDQCMQKIREDKDCMVNGWIEAGIVSALKDAPTY